MRVFAFTSMAFALSASATLAATVTVNSFSVSDYNAQLGAFGGQVVGENFEGLSEGNVGGLGSPLSTNVGSFRTLGGTGSGGTVKKADNTFTGLSGTNPNDGTQLAIRDGNVFGRVSTTKALTGNAGDAMFLDSNDT